MDTHIRLAFILIVFVTLMLYQFGKTSYEDAIVSVFCTLATYIIAFRGKNG